ncbi:conserved hypothetical protein [Gluconacetobacter diazotrophicus PA1 5]|uniref:DUF934 domain-containing protein n=1 Tax=Gluconacetobacter diazotrophicus TaxID=33996 RepID=A0A7W4FCU5_GLUDI|nr:DUF934 domain-containing protein [Gluconacetobacter diazotrophicus]ACI52853.1 conserved hypothetical protein [Gluconacetobacter diazotrophicus PA1 5]MBB2155408.1 DUF934 domain-containing protein [Gluconacetobacter diazotrophicus]TWB09002.1 uncharacterized protein (DUF934 family) [Gluconacetobacter diazotrophicus]
MPLLEDGRLVADRWTAIGPDDALPATGPVIVPLARIGDGLARNSNEELGVAIPPDAEIAVLRTALPRLSLVAVTFPSFRDGRAFSQARALREHLGFAGDIRVTGRPLPDQYEFLLRCGATTVELPDDADPAVWALAHARFHTAYQPAVRGELAEGFGLRRLLRV